MSSSDMQIEIQRERRMAAAKAAKAAATPITSAIVAKAKAGRPKVRKAAMTAAPSTCADDADDVLEKFADFLHDLGIDAPKDIIADGQIHRCGTIDKPSENDASYCLAMTPTPHGWAQNWRDGDGITHWGDDSLPPDVAERFKATAAEQVATTRVERQKAIDTARTEARITATNWWNCAREFMEGDSHPYLIRKQVKPYGIRHDALGHIVVPVRSLDGTIQSIHSIDANGAKLFLKGGAKKGNFHVIGEIANQPEANLTIVIAEGYATAASIHEATGHPCVVAFDAGNLLPVATAIRQASPTARIIMAADDDHETDGNPGMAKATAAAVAVNAMLASPWPMGSPPAGQTDFNDLHVSTGLPAVADAVGKAMRVEDDANPLEAALINQKTDAGAMMNPKVLAMLRVVRATDPQRWAVIREAVKQCRNLKMEDFDKLTAPDKVEQGSSTFPDDAPWEDEVDGAELLDELVELIRRFVVADDESIQATALWVVATYFVEVVGFAPILNITAPEKRCGKSTLLEVLDVLVLKSMMTSNISPAAIFRFIEKYCPTMLIDEVDSFLASIPEARGLLNSGVQPGGCVYRTVGEDFEPVRFSTFGFKALAGIGSLADTLNDRSILVRMSRKFSSEKTQHLRHAKRDKPEMFTTLRRKMMRFVEDNAAEFAAIRPKHIEAIHDRANDCWEPLLQVAELAGTTWLLRAMTAAVSLMKEDFAKDSTNIDLLTAIRRAFIVNEVDKISSVALVETLIREPDGRWSDYNCGKPISNRQIADRLRHFHIINGAQRLSPGTVYKAIGLTAKEVASGYSLDKFQDVFKRYLPLLTEDQVANLKELAKEALTAWAATPWPHKF